MHRLSLRLRSTLIALLALALFIPLTAWVLDKAHMDSLRIAKFNELKLMNLALISAFELTADGPEMPELLYEDQLNLPDSGYLGLVKYDNRVIWQSTSAINLSVPATLPDVPVGKELVYADFTPFTEQSERYFLYGYAAEFAIGDRFVPVQFFVLNHTDALAARQQEFMHTVWQGLMVLGAVLLVVLMLGNALMLAPVRTLIAEIRQTSQGHQPALHARYPTEFSHLQHSINQLIETEHQQRTRYKNSLGDLAHSLKTPLAVALGTPGLPADARDALRNIDSLIQRQLKRAVAGQRGWQHPVAVAPVAERLVGSMQKIYRGKELAIALNQAAPAWFKGDETDLYEMLGNVLDNACKAARQQVSVHIQRDAEQLVFTVDDDGPGIAPATRERLLQRGQRLDTYEEGQGIGLAVVSDLVAVYGGRLALSASPAGGTRVTLTFSH